MHLILLRVFALVSIYSIFLIKQAASEGNQDTCTTMGCYSASELLSKVVDFSANPCEKPYQYVCGNWLKNHPRDPNKRKISLRDERFLPVFEQQSIDMLENNATVHSQSIQFIKRMYNSCMDADTRNAMKSQPIQKWIDQLGGLPLLKQNWTGLPMNFTQFAIWTSRMLGRQDLFRLEFKGRKLTIEKAAHIMGYSSIYSSHCDNHDEEQWQQFMQLFDAYSLTAINKSDVFNRTLLALQSNLPKMEKKADITGYCGTNSGCCVIKDKVNVYKETLQQYVRLFAADSFKSINISDVRNEVQLVFQFEKDLMDIFRSHGHEETNETNLTYLQSAFPKIDWFDYLKGALHRDFSILLRGQSPSNTIIHYYPRYMQALFDKLNNTDQRTIVNWAILAFINRFAVYLDDRYKKAYETLLQTKTSDLWWRTRNIAKEDVRKPTACTTIIADIMPVAVQALYARTFYLKPDVLSDVKSIFANVLEAFHEIIDQSIWLDNCTKQRLLEKSNNMTIKHGEHSLYLNDAQLDSHYQKMNLSSNGSYFDAALQALLLKTDLYELKEVVKIKSYYNEPRIVEPLSARLAYLYTENAIALPAGAIQSSSYQYNWPMFMKYARLGFEIAHEFSHGFDTTGMEDGLPGIMLSHQRHGFCTKNTSTNFVERVECFIKSYSDYHISDINMKVNGYLTKDENIADVEGLRLALKAYEIYLKKTSKIEKPLPDLNVTIQQVFLIGSAINFCSNMSDVLSHHLMKKDTHTLDPVRIRGLLSNTEAFAAAYSCPAYSNANPRLKCRIW